MAVRLLPVPLMAALGLIVTFLLLAPVAHATDVKYCDGTDYPVKVTGVDIHPNPVVRGKLAKFSISATTGAPLSGGKLTIGVSYFGIYIHEETHDLCEETSCPISTGNFILSHSQSLPIFTPPGTYTLEMKMFGETGDQLTCITFDFSIGFWADNLALPA